MTYATSYVRDGRCFTMLRISQQRRMRLATGGLAVALLCVMGAARAAVTADPATVTLTSPKQSVEVRLMKDGAPLPAAEVKGYRFLASDHDYKEMIKLDKKDGSVTITPSDLIEVGSYDLEIATAAGAVSIKVLTPLSELASIYEKKAAELGITVEAFKEKYGLMTPTGRAAVELNLPAVYYEGQVLALSMPLDAKLEYVWTVNGKVMEQGPGKNIFNYVFNEPGDVFLAYEERENGVTVAKATATTKVTAMPAIPWEVPCNAEATLKGPEGYASYIWKIDDKEVSSEPVLTHTFKNPGQHTLECKALSSKDGSGGFLRVRYKTTVTPTK